VPCARIFQEKVIIKEPSLVRGLPLLRSGLSSDVTVQFYFLVF